MGRPFRTHAGRRWASSRDPGHHSSDSVWRLVEKMLEGDADAAIVLADVIEEGVSAGRTKFVKIYEKGYKRGGKVYGAGVKEGEFAAITPGRSIVLFGVREQYNPGGGHSKRGYMSRYQMGSSAEYDSYNLAYFGQIIGITDKRVIIDKNAGYRARTSSGELGRYPVSKASLDIAQFSRKNWDPRNLEEGLKRNREWSD
jgi:hypothetical protein